MRSAVEVADGDGFSVHAVTCADDHRGWSGTEVGDHYRVVLVRRGRFRRMADGRRADLDPTLAYLGRPGEEERFAHPAGGDVCTSISLSPARWRSLAGTARRRQTVYVDARLDLAHRRLLATSRAPDHDYAVVEDLFTLLGTALTSSGPEPLDHPGADAVAAARELITTAHPAADALIPLSDLLGVSPYHLSRAFTRRLGVSLTYYRNRVRVGRAMDRLEAGEPHLATLAADLGFADQAHLTRTVRHHLGHTPAALRRLLTDPPGRAAP
ncbi:helix-turn-helix domain-containing protein [Nonomuraea sp. NPDC050556]|uniref:helix-turn-helix domain-containing protein n=1 Tax=Nonomuraea sp. NPDC050556 TaxID=3364369 RepID=UPI0037AD05EB